MRAAAIILLVISLIVNSYSESRGALRLVRFGEPSLTQAWNSGIVQIRYDNTWGNVCDDFAFGSTEADVVCHQLSYSGASYHTNTELSQDYGTDNNITLLEDVACSSSDLLVLLQCSVSAQYSIACSSNNDVIVECYSTRIWDNPYTGQVRLTGGEYSNTGLLEIYCNSQWGTVCDDNYDSTDARVTCNQLGYNDYFSYDHLSLTGDIGDPIWLRSFPCSSSSLQCVHDCVQCPSSTQLGCTHGEDVTLDCAYSSFLSSSTVSNETCQITTDTTGPGGVGAVRLLNSGSTSLYNTAGRVQVWYDGQWGNICYGSTFGRDEANVICHQLGWDGAIDYYYAQYDGFDKDFLQTFIDDLQCDDSSYLNMFQCSYSTIIDSSCTNDQDVSVTCSSNRIWDSPYTGEIRLSRGQYSNQGLLEVYCNGQWGTVCDDSFGSNEATVVCTQLGYSNYYSYDSLSITGNLSQSIWFDDVSCSSSSYSCLGSCITCPSSEYHNCDHGEDVTIECTETSNPVSTTVDTCVDADTGPTDSSSTDDTSSSNSGLVGGIVGGTFFIIFISVGFPICIIICVSAGTRSTYRARTRVDAGPQTVTTTAVVTQPVEVPLQQFPQNTSASYPVQGYAPSNQQNPPYNPTGYNNMYGQGGVQYPYPSAPEQPTPYPSQGPPQGYSTTPQQPPPSYDQFVQENCPADQPPYPI